MDIAGARWSTGEIMLAIVPIAVWMVVFQGVWWIALFPPVMLSLLTINLGILFGILGGRRWQTRILGMMLGGVAGLIFSLLFYALEMRLGEPGVIGSMCLHRLESWSGAPADPGGVLAAAFRFLGRHMVEIEGGLLDVIGVAAIWAGGRLERRYRGRRRALPPLAGAGRC